MKQIGMAGAALAAMGAVGAAAWALSGAVTVRTPADMLPADRTVALFAVRGKEDLAAFARWFPSAVAYPDVSEPAWVASVEADRRKGWLLFRATPEGSTEPYLITASDQALLTLTSAGGESVAASDAYEDVRPDADAASWAYLAPGSAENGVLGGWLRTPSALSVSRMEAGLTLRIRDDERSESGLGALTHSPLRRTAFSFSAKDWKMLGAQLSRHVSGEPRLTGRALMETAMEPLFGSEISPEHDLLPLLRDGGQLHVAAGTGGVLRFALSGTADSSQDAEAAIQTLRAAFRTARPSVRREQRTFEGGFAMDWMRADADALDETEKAAGGWDGLLQRRSGGQTLATAVSGARFLISNDASVLDAAAAGGEAVPAGGTAFDGGATAAGTLDPAGLRAILAAVFPSAPPALPFGDALGAAPMAWTADDDGRRITLRFRPL